MQKKRDLYIIIIIAINNSSYIQNITSSSISLNILHNWPISDFIKLYSVYNYVLCSVLNHYVYLYYTIVLARKVHETLIYSRQV